MLDESELSPILQLWEKRSKDNNYDASYRGAILDCLYDIKTMLSHHMNQEMLRHYAEIQHWEDNIPPEEAQEAILEDEADKYLSTMEAHEKTA